MSLSVISLVLIFTCNYAFGLYLYHNIKCNDMKLCSNNNKGLKEFNMIDYNCSDVERFNTIGTVSSPTNQLFKTSKLKYSYGIFMIASSLFDRKRTIASVQSNQFISPYDLEHVFDNIEIDGSDSFRPEDFERLDESSDLLFYQNPRFVEHIDSEALLALERFHGKVMKSFNCSIDILDLCSSWVSHVPDEVDVKQFVGLGMNMAELERNKRLTERYIQDLNQNYTLPFASHVFDVVLLQLSIDYLIHPLEVMKEISRVLRPNGVVIIS